MVIVLARHSFSDGGPLAPYKDASLRMKVPVRLRQRMIELR